MVVHQAAQNEELEVAPAVFVMTTRYSPASSGSRAVKVSESSVAPAIA